MGRAAAIARQIGWYYSLIVLQQIELVLGNIDGR